MLDVGSLEHVFDFPCAIRNLMRMVEIGGHLILVTPTNNEAGHGFYQFSPELLFRVLSSRFGFEVEEMLIKELGRPRARWYRVSDPELLRCRAQFRSRNVTYLYVRARRVGAVTNFAPPPQQSDYAAAWEVSHFPDTARPANRAPATSPARQILSRCTANRIVYYLLSRPIAWARQQRMFHRVPYTRLPSHFMKLGRADPV